MNILDDLCRKIVCPPKTTYSLHDIGSVMMSSGRRIDFQCTNDRGHQLKCSVYVPLSVNIPTTMKMQKGKSFVSTNGKCVIYLHSMNGSRLESVGYVETILKLGYCFCNFDFSGCGNSDGVSISFGANQRYDTHAVIQYLEQNFGIKHIVLWGRSMGAVCAFKYAELANQISWNLTSKSQIQISGLILDSPFKSFSTLAVQLGESVTRFPRFLISAAYHILKGRIEQLGNFSIEDLQLDGKHGIKNMSMPALFLASKQDITIPSYHSEQLFDSYGGEQKELHFINGLHNETRDYQYLALIKGFVYRAMIASGSKKQDLTNIHRMRFNNLMNNTSINGEEFQMEGKENRDSCTCKFFGVPLVKEKIVWERREAQISSTSCSSSKILQN